MGLADALRERTKPLHAEAERSGVMAALLRGEASRAAYLRLLASLHAIYDALEGALAAQAAHPAIAPMLEPGFARREALAADLAGAVGPEWPARVAPSPEARAYAEHLRQLAVEHPPRLLAHAWLRYLGDLNGGQVLARIVRRSPALGDVPTRFYEFPALADPRAAAATWRARLDAAPLAPEVTEAIIVEACEGFRRHIALFRAIAAQDVPSSPASPA